MTAPPTAPTTLAERTRALGERLGLTPARYFTPEIRSVFRRLLAPELKGPDGRDIKKILKDDAPAPGSVPFKVNAKYPDGQPLPTVPVNLLLSLPELPAPLEYRIVGQHLLLLDTAADLVVDYILNVTRGVDVAESEPNGSTAQALPSAPATVFGSIANSDDVDFFSFEAAAGQTLILDIDSEVLGSSLDAEMNLSDPQTGIEYFYSDQADGDDPRFNIVLPFTGRYIIGVGAFARNSSGFYRLNLSLVPGVGAPLITGITRISKKLFEVSGSSLSSGTRAETNGIQRRTTFVGPGLIRVKAKTKAGTIVTVTNSPDGRRSNPLVVQ